MADRVLYVATGQRHIREAGASLRSLWRHDGGIPVTMYVDRPSRPHLREWGVPDAPRGVSLEIVELAEPTYSWADKPVALSKGGTDEESLLFLDTDTRVCGSIMEIFEVLGSFDLAAAHAPIRLDRRQPSSLARRVPAAFPELNTGVIALRRTTAVARLLERWRLMHLETLRSIDPRTVGDQATFRVALYLSDVRFTVLPPEYNCRFTFPTYVHGPVRILHGRWPDLGRIEREVNRISGPRVFIPGVGVLKASPILLRFRRRYHSWRKRGILRVLRGRFWRSTSVEEGKRGHSGEARRGRAGAGERGVPARGRDGPAQPARPDDDPAG